MFGINTHERKGIVAGLGREREVELRGRLNKASADIGSLSSGESLPTSVPFWVEVAGPLHPYFILSPDIWAAPRRTECVSEEGPERADS